MGAWVDDDQQDYRSLFDNAVEGMYRTSPDGRYLAANDALARIYGYESAEALMSGLTDIAGALYVNPHDRDRFRTALEDSSAVHDFVARVYRKDGSQIWINENARSVLAEDGTLKWYEGFVQDITDRIKTDERLRLAASVFDTAAEAIMVLNDEFCVTAVNPAYSAITGFPARDVIGGLPPFLEWGRPIPEHPRISMAILRKVIKSHGKWSGEQWNRRKNGEHYAEQLSVVPIPGSNGQAGRYLVVFSDVTQRKHDEERIRYQASYDQLTGLPNRALFMDMLARSLLQAEREGEMVGLMFVDLDGFKMVNDTMGHDMGDLLLQEVAARLKRCMRSSDTVARLGGDEFTVLMPQMHDFHNAPRVAERITETLRAPFNLMGKEAFISASIGITTFPNDAIDAATLLKNADAAMYRAKEQGKQHFQFFTSEMNAEIEERLILINGLNTALERNEFVLHYQPKVDLVHGRLTGAEALLRWHHPELGLVSSSKFIPIMEDSGLIGSVSEWVIETACRQHRQWLNEGLNIKVAVNLSVRQLRQPGFAQTVADLLDRAGVDPGGLELEITESMLMKDTENAVRTLGELADMGVSLAMDDFGTGYSSLSYLKRFPLHTIKIDRSFINNIASDPDDYEIIRTILSMGQSLRRRVVAEGVETRQQLEILRQLGCDEIQGFVISPAVPANELAALVRRGPLLEADPQPVVRTAIH
ncbi:EAL domain-containing protein [Emcibacter sp. SYSU 3D8]|uniref:putative bifunctional diguanylate cyclase/phosphodiesterase n=1 Tax=Emcibacter sp. SYSU 3D8 TaxID=3133969 RepID=UPI0031FF0AF7